jgi:hypothetical protein
MLLRAMQVAIRGIPHLQQSKKIWHRWILDIAIEIVMQRMMRRQPHQSCLPGMEFLYLEKAQRFLARP